MRELVAFSHDLLWQERSAGCVANLSRRDGGEFVRVAGRARIHTVVTSFALTPSNEALAAVRSGSFGLRFQAAGVFVL
jgi:propanol-preferring alcohol dehydrogenase